MTVLDTSTILLNTQEYVVLREELAQKLGRRRWRTETRSMPLSITRPDVMAGAMSGEYRIVWDAFNRGIGTDIIAPPGTSGLSTQVYALSTGELTVAPRLEAVTQTSTPDGYMAMVITFNGLLFIFSGRYVFVFNTSIGAVTTDRDFGAGIRPTDAIVHNNELVVGFGGSTNAIQTRTTGGVWTTATDATYADHWTKEGERLWRATAANEVSNIGPTDNPRTLASWSTGLPVGDDDFGITDLNTLGEQIAVSKPDGLYLGDRGAIFPNVFSGALPILDPDNGRRTVVAGDKVFFPHAGASGLLMYPDMVEVGIARQYNVMDPTDTVVIPAGTRIRALMALGDELWATTEYSGLPMADPTGVRVTTDGGATYINRTTQTTDRDYNDAGSPTILNLSSLDTSANGDYFIVGYSAAFNGVHFDISSPNGNAATLTVEMWNGTTWLAVPAAELTYDGTTLAGLDAPNTPGAATLARSGFVTWTGYNGGWSSQTIDGTAAFWARFRVSALLDASVTIREIRVLPNALQTGLWRGRARRTGDPWDHPVVWEKIATPGGYFFHTGLGAVSIPHPFQQTGAIVSASSYRINFLYLPPEPHGVSRLLPVNTTALVMDLPKHGGGASWINKQFVRAWLYGDGLTANSTVALAYRLTDGAAYTTLATYNSAGGQTTAFAAASNGYWIQPRFSFAGFGASTTRLAKISRLEISFRVLPANTIGYFQHAHELFLELGNNQFSTAGGVLQDATVQLANLLALRGTAVAFISLAEQTSETVIVWDIDVEEVFQEGLADPVLAVRVTLLETTT